MQKTNAARAILLSAALIGALGVALGAFGAHGLEATLEANDRADTFQTASLYHLVHTLALLGTGILSLQLRTRLLAWAATTFVVGVVGFSGSLYVLAIFNLPIMGAIAPIGGTAFIAGWLLVGAAVWQQS